MIEALENKNIYYSEYAFVRLSQVVENRPAAPFFVLCDTNTEKNCLPLLLKQVPALRSAQIKVVPPGEASKSLDRLSAIWDWLTEQEAHRESVLINLGGGMLTDLGGFAAATFKRGISVIHFPTSLLAMVDAALGGKNGINWQAFKNQLGSFYEPLMIGIHADFLISLPAEERLNGYAEMMKHGLIADAAHWQDLLKIDPVEHQQWEELIKTSASIKMKIVAEDPRESGLRKVLNYGHSIGHVLEGWSQQQGRPLDHGHAVALGIWGEALLSHQYLGLSKEALIQIEEQVRLRYELPKLAIAKAEFKAKLLGDKKNQGRGFNFTLLSKIGQAQFNQTLDWSAVEAGLKNWEILDWS